jgi:hypothetical protein
LTKSFEYNQQIIIRHISIRKHLDLLIHAHLCNVFTIGQKGKKVIITKYKIEKMKIKSKLNYEYIIICIILSVLDDLQNKQK